MLQSRYNYRGRKHISLCVNLLMKSLRVVPVNHLFNKAKKQNIHANREYLLVQTRETKFKFCKKGLVFREIPSHPLSTIELVI